MPRTLESLLDELERDRSLREPGRMRERGEALDRLEIHRACGASGEGAPGPAQLRERVEALCAGFEAVDAELQQRIRRDVQRGAGAHALLEWARSAGPDGDLPGDGYDYLDTLVSGILQIEEPDMPAAPMAGMVFYQPTPARHIFGMLARTALDERDVLVDLGSGLGQVPLLAAICTGARCVGIEWEAAYVRCARRCAQALDLGRVTFVQGDVRAADLSTGTVFYLYTPFEGRMLREVLDRLKAEADTRVIRVCTLGPCTATVARERWLHGEDEWRPDRPAVFRSTR